MGDTDARASPDRTDEPARGDTHPPRAVTPVIGIILAIAITVVLAAVLGGIVIGIPGGQSTTPQASLSFAVDTTDDRIEVEHEAGDALYSDRTRIVWEINGSTYRSHPTDEREGMQSSQYAVFEFDGPENSSGAWTNYPSPGNHTIEADHVITATVYDTESGNRIYRDSFAVNEVQEDL
ncbi:MAG: type IV pilin N-terminal domain-containing protein [Haloarculaceae archaeon]